MEEGRLWNTYHIKLCFSWHHWVSRQALNRESLAINLCGKFQLRELGQSLCISHILMWNTGGVSADAPNLPKALLPLYLRAAASLASSWWNIDTMAKTAKQPCIKAAWQGQCIVVMFSALVASQSIIVCWEKRPPIVVASEASAAISRQRRIHPEA